VVADDQPSRHVYRVVSGDGTVVSEHQTLARLSDFLEGYEDREAEPPDGIAATAR